MLELSHHKYSENSLLKVKYMIGVMYLRNKNVKDEHKANALKGFLLIFAVAPYMGVWIEIKMGLVIC